MLLGINCLLTCKNNLCFGGKVLKVNLYMHGGSKNHGCEAIVRSTIKINDSHNAKLYSYRPSEDMEYKIDKICSVLESGRTVVKYSLNHFMLKIRKILTRSSDCYFYNEFKYLLNNLDEKSLYFSIGGDNYCYAGCEKSLEFINRMITEKNVKSVLWGCSVEPELLKQEKVINDLKRYSLITPRESITYNALIEAGIDKNTKLFPDPAFTLDTVNLDLPKEFIEGKTIGINVSPLIIDHEANQGATMKNYVALLDYIINNTDMQIALIPHVVWKNNDDRKPLHQLYSKFKQTGRVIIIEDHNCMELKGYIARCRIFIGARTHATIAAYSSCVPTLVIGYSVKAKGIAKDIFGTYENYVIPVQTLSNKDDLINAFEWMLKNEDEIKKHLKTFMPQYIEKAWQAGQEVKKILQK